MKFVKGETDSYIFHMSWTENKDNKVLFLRQLGEWYVTDKCIGKSMADIIGIGSSSENSALVLPCCVTEPLLVVTIATNHQNSLAKVAIHLIQEDSRFGNPFNVM
ncbi:hypothetical protein ACHAW5_005398 [Stephanodiscus triporus]|uniref:Uncharacterized protein n=1 Tax=Stephanodiscus triporus TaxID=2934178 RepID=A0ABD3P880_9STRA